MDYASALLGIESEAIRLIAGVEHHVRMRKVHPTYGYTLGDGRKKLARVEGVLYAYSVATGLNNASEAASTQAAAEALNLEFRLASVKAQLGVS